MSDIQNLSAKSIKPLTLLSKTNEIIDTVNEQLNTSYSENNPLLTSVDGVCTWTVTHNLGTEEVSCTVYQGDSEVMVDSVVTSENVVTITINSSSNITAETYSVLILAKGGLDSPISPTITVDSTLSSTSTNPVQNKVLYPSLNGFLPSETVIHIELDGSGDFTSLIDAINYLTGKWSNGTVTIQLGNGTFNNADFLLNTLNFNIPYLKIYGNGVSNTTLYSSSQSGDGFQIIYGNSTVELNGFTYKKPSTSIQSYGIGIRPTYMSNVRILDVTVEGCGVAIGTVGSNYCNILGNVTIKWANRGIDSHQAGFLKVTDAHINFNNVNSAFCVREGGRLQALSPIVTYTNVTNKVSQTVGTATNNGWITGISV